uniref:(northern house mosquito) hypothetical protein n=1 Tax=Culex pipiens TaxID=7175 RepID=A0A8D8C797_CULPI
MFPQKILTDLCESPELLRGMTMAQKVPSERRYSRSDLKTGTMGEVLHYAPRSSFGAKVQGQKRKSARSWSNDDLTGRRNDDSGHSTTAKKKISQPRTPVF